MGTLKRKLKEYISLFKIKRRDKDSMKIIKWSLMYLLFCMLLYLAMTLYEWVVTGHANLTEFRQYITAIGGLTIAIKFFSDYLVDKDGDGVPDQANKERKYPYDTR